ncbi:MAG TPA: TonB-dependent receptor [Acidobacteriaceae bacterium]|nr:TonB-dependent receptor [Acidobacteriaceae bacterium]
MFILVLLMCVSAGMAQVQATGTISGHITDASGASLPGAKVQITERETGITSSTVTNATGYYSVPLLKPGDYSVQVEKNGFKTSLHSNLVLQVAQVLEEDFNLEVGSVTQQVTVTGGTPLLNTETTDLGNVISRTPLLQLPLNGRNFAQLGLLVPGTNGGATGEIRSTGNGNETQRNGAEIVANGARGSFNTYLLDGMNDNDQLVGTVKVFPNLEDIAEFKVQIGNYDAAYASGGAVVNVTTQSGTNLLHGSAFEFLRNSALDTRQYFDKPGSIPPYKQNQFGVSLGGPILRNKIFYFVDYQGLRIHESSSAILTEPTTQLRSGDFSGYPQVIYDPSTYSAATNTRQAFNGNVIPGNRLDPVAQALLATMPLPNLPGVANNLRINTLQAVAQDQGDARVDTMFSAKDSMFARYTYGRADITYPSTPVQINGKFNPFAFAAGGATGSLRPNHDPSLQATLQETHLLSPTMTNQLAVGYTREALSVAPLDAGYNTSQLLGLSGSDSPGQGSGLASLSISGFTGYSAGFMPEIVPQNTEEYSDTLSMTRGAHTAAMGLDVIHNDFGFLQVPNLYGALSWTGAYTNNPAKTGGTGSGFADFLLGLPSSTSKTSLVAGVPYESYSEIGAFLQDTWRVTPRLTLTPGLRYDLFTNPVERHNRQSDFIPGPGGFVGLGNTGSIALAGQNGVSSGILTTQSLNFSPRVGLAYRLGNNNVLRGAYGLFYFDEQGTGSSARLFINYPDTVTNAVNCSTTLPCLSTSVGIPSTPSANNLPQAVYLPVSNATSKVQQWNLTLERQMSSSIALRGSYVGSHGGNLNIALNPDTAYPGPGAVTPRQPYAQYSSISAWEPIGISNYNALQVSAEDRMGSGLYILAAYTYSRSLDEGAGGNSSSGDPRNNIQDPRNIRADYGLSNFNYKHRLTDSMVYQLPVGRGRKFLASAGSWVNGAIGDWELTSILTLQSGAPFTAFLANPTANTGTFTRPNRVCDGNLSGSQQSIHQWYNVGCFVNPPLYTFGNAGRNILIGPGMETWDFGLDKDFEITERLGMQFRVETFNLLNHANFGLPNGSIGNPGAGTITSVITNSRETQFAARLHW